MHFHFSVPIWIRVARLPMGLMKKEVAIAIGDDIGEFLEVDFENDDMAARRYLRVKVRIDIHKPLQRGIIVDMGEDVEERWCPLKHEFLLDFCYIYGRIGHIDKVCSEKLVPDEKMPFDKELRYIPPKMRFGVDFRRGGGSGRWISGGLGSSGSEGKSRSDVLSWRKDDSAKVNLGKVEIGMMISAAKQSLANNKLQQTVAKNLEVPMNEGGKSAAVRVEDACRVDDDARDI